MSVSEKILQWYDPHKRGLPWRNTRDPYKIWVSEIMLQQTRAAAAVPYYERFIERYPTVEALAESDEDELLKLWQGLGYYSRAKNLRKAAMRVAKEGMPKDAKTLETLPGIGAYTAGAVASIAYGEPVAAIDGNLLRIFSRLYAVEARIDEPAGKKEIAALAAAEIPETAPGDFNQALMDLGSEICTPKRPRCLACPLHADCIAFREGRQEEFPHKKPKKEKTRERHLALAIRHNGAYLVEKRTEGLLSSLWGFPLLPGRWKKEDVEKYLAERAIVAKEIRFGTRYEHVFTHKIWEITVVVATAEAVLTAAEEYTWADVDALREKYAIPSAFRPVLEEIYGLD